MHDEGVHVLYGSAAGLTLERSTYFPIALDSGWQMASGNFGRSRHTDLAIGAPVDDSGSRGGNVTVPYGSTTGLTIVAIKNGVRTAAASAGQPKRVTASAK